MRGSRHPLVIGHRGAPGYRPEHSAASYELAFALGADAVEPDIVATKDGVLVLRHENEISGTTDVAQHPEFAARRSTKRVDGQVLTGWFTEDFTWDELATLRAVERLPKVRQASRTFDGRYPILRLEDLMTIIDRSSDTLGRTLGMVAEIKHATYFAEIGLPLDELFANQISGWADADRLVVESFEQTVLGEIRDRGVAAEYVYLIEASGAAPDLVARDGSAAAPYAAQVTDIGLAGLATEVDGLSFSKSLVLSDARSGVTSTGLVERAKAAGLQVFVWTLRPENRFLFPSMRGSGGKNEFGDWAREFRAILATGVDGVFADQPDLVVSLLSDPAGE